MRSLIAVPVALLSFALGAPARAEMKVGVVDLQRAVLEIDEGRAAKARLQTLVDSLQRELEREQEELRKEKELLDKQASALSEETRVERQTVLQKRLFNLSSKAEKGRQDLQKKEQAEMSTLFQKMDAVVAQIAQREGLTLVLDRSTVVYGPPSLDITNELVRLYNDTYKAAPAGKKADSPKKGG
jgi:outer membrane protein